MTFEVLCAVLTPKFPKDCIFDLGVLRASITCDFLYIQNSGSSRITSYSFAQLMLYFPYLKNKNTNSSEKRS